MKVTPIPHEVFTYEVESSAPAPYRVDLTLNHGAGGCTCEFHRFTALPNLERRIYAIEQREGNVRMMRSEAAGLAHIAYAANREGVTECKHVACARDHFTRTKVMPFLATMNDGIDPKSLMNNISTFLR